MTTSLPANLPVTEATCWPDKKDLFGLLVSCVNYDEAVRCIIDAASNQASAVVSCHAVHAVMTLSSDPQLREAANRFAMITPDGQPVRWALNLLHHAGLKDRVYGPELMLRVLKAAATRGLSVYFYGGSPAALDGLLTNLRAQFPSLIIAGGESPPYRQLTPEEMAEVAERINGSRADITFIGLGCPKQDMFAAAQSDHIHGVQICVGAAFDFHAGATSMAPKWMQRSGLEWLFRLCSEPKRLWRRYLITNSQFLYQLGKSYAAKCFSSQTPEPSSSLSPQQEMLPR